MRTIGKRLLWPVGAVAVLAVLFVINRLFIQHPLWDWIKLLIVPAILAGGGLWFNTQQRVREQRIAERRALDDSLQAYLDGMSQLLTDKELPLHRAQPGDSLSTVARARTLTVLSRLDSSRKRSVLEFLYESRLIDQEQAFLDDQSDLIKRRPNIVSLQQADLREANLYRANLSGADLRWAYLYRADLREANLSGANLRRAYLREADLREANLSGANLRRAYVTDQARPDGAPTPKLGSTAEEFREEVEQQSCEALEQQAKHLAGATMPNGQKYEDWLKDKEDHGEDEKDR
jgi:hypothetical protein